MKIFYFLMFKYLKNLYQNYKRFIFIYLFIYLFFSTGEIQLGKIQLGETQQFINTPHFLKKLSKHNLAKQQLLNLLIFNPLIF